VLIVLCHLQKGFHTPSVHRLKQSLQEEGGLCIILSNKQVKFIVIHILYNRLNMYYAIVSNHLPFMVSLIHVAASARHH